MTPVMLIDSDRPVPVEPLGGAGGAGGAGGGTESGVALGKLGRPGGAGRLSVVLIGGGGDDGGVEVGVFSDEAAKPRTRTCGTSGTERAGWRGGTYERLGSKEIG
jgi:hypothetical protein